MSRRSDPPETTRDVLPGPDGLSDADLDALYRMQPVARPPADFADRVLARRAADHAPTDPPPGRRRRPIAIALTVAALAAAALLWVRPAGPRAGVVEAERVTTAALSDRAVAVADPGARIEWALTDGGLTVKQTRGRVFYRVDDGPLTVHTPAGDVAVTGTCFTVEVEPMSPTLKSAAVGALVGVAATIAVYEGAVRVHNEHGTVDLKPGERGRAIPEAAPIRADDDRRIYAVAPTPPTPPTPPAAPAPAPSAPGDRLAPQQVEELQALLTDTRAELERVERALAAEQAMRIESEGAPMPFPADLPDRFGEDALRTRVQAAFEQSGVAGEVVSIDCGEFPCVVYAELESDQEKGHEQLLESDAMAPYADDGKNVSVWGTRTRDAEGETRHRNFVGMALMPKGVVEGEERRALDKRLQFRNQQAAEAFMPAMRGDEPPE